MSPRVVVIGGGLAGTAAALGAARAGAQVTLVSRRAGRAAFHGGLWTLGDPDLRPLPRAETLRDGLAAAVARRPGHPLARGGDPLDRLRAAVETVFLGFEAFGRPALRLDGPFARLVHASGRRVRAFGHDRRAGADVPDDTAVLGIEALGTAGARLVARALSGGGDGPRVIALDTAPGRGPVATPLRYARHLDGDDFFVRFAESLRALLGAGTPEMLLVPPVMGVATNRAQDLEWFLGIPVREWIDETAGTAGERLLRACEAATAAAGVTRIDADVRRIDTEGMGVARVYLESGDVLETADAGVVLATGKFLGGGLVRHGGAVREPLLDLPLVLDGAPLTGAPAATAGAFAESQPLFRIGVAVDDALRPLGRSGEAAALNLHAAGHLLGGFCPFTDGIGDAVDLITGVEAGRRAAGGDA